MWNLGGGCQSDCNHLKRFESRNPEKLIFCNISKADRIWKKKKRPLVVKYFKNNMPQMSDNGFTSNKET